MLIFGWGPFPRLGVAGAGLAVVIYYLIATVVLIGYLTSARSGLRLPLDFRLIEKRLLADILRVGGLSAVGTIQANLTVILVTGAVGLFGTDAIAGYGIASRLDYILVPLLFALGTAALTMVGTNFGAGQVRRAERIAWIAALFGAGITELIGLAVAVFPQGWLTLFSTDPACLPRARSICARSVHSTGWSDSGCCFISPGKAPVVWCGRFLQALHGS